jgi:hypothetical protein
MMGRVTWGRHRGGADGRVPFSRVAADEVYGQNPHLRSWLEGEGISHVMAVPCSETFATPAGKMRADALTALVPAAGWQTMRCGDGSKGPRQARRYVAWYRHPPATIRDQDGTELIALTVNEIRRMSASSSTSATPEQG